MSILKGVVITILIIPNFVLGANLLVGGTASCNNEYAPNPCTYANDGNTATEWVSNNTLPAWWQYDFGNGNTEIINEFLFWTVDGNTSYQDYQIQGSDNGTDWTDLDTGVKPEHDTTATYSFENCNGYRYYRARFTTNWRGGDGYTGFKEVEGNNDTPTSCGTSNTDLATSTIEQTQENIFNIFLLFAFGFGYGLYLTRKNQ